jgi:hypothetical protein
MTDGASMPGWNGEPVRVQTQVEGSRRVLYTGPGAVERARMAVRLGAAAVLIAGALAAARWPWAIALCGAACALFVLGPRRIQAERLIDLDVSTGTLHYRTEAGDPAQLAVADARAIRAAYGTSGWEGRSVLWVATDAGETAVLTLPGTDARQAEAVARSLSALLGLPGSYVDPLGREVRWSAPSRPPAPGR